jgi:NhaP-type Na+/H+ and K+/H+ antiporter
MKWELAIIAATVLTMAGVSRGLTGTPVTPAMVFVLVGVLVGPLVIDEVTAAPTGEGVRTLAEAIVLAILLAPTDAALGEAVVTEPRLPSRIRQGLNVESGRNDGIYVPLLLIALAAADIQDKSTSGHHALTAPSPWM